MHAFTKLFTEHPQSVGETYIRHWFMAFSFAGMFFKLACICLVHAFLPFLFERKASQSIESLHQRMVVQRHTTQ